MKDGPDLPFAFADKVIHAGIYFIFALAWFLAFSKREKTSFFAKNAIFLSVLFAILYGIIMEFMQETLIENRHGDWLDALANSAGAILAGILIKYYLGYRIKLKTKI